MNEKRICPVERAGGLDNPVRKIFQDPNKILRRYIKENMDIVDLGCGPGYFTIEIAKMLKGTGNVIAVDLQEGMLEKVNNKISGTPLEKSIRLHKCQADEIGLKAKVDFILAFYMVHEVPDKARLFEELKSILKSGGRLFIVEPKFHVSGNEFGEMLKILEDKGFIITERPKVFFSRAVLLNISD